MRFAFLPTQPCLLYTSRCVYETALAEVKLMNKVKTYNVELTETGKFLTGKQQVKFSDFGIIPPKKMAGMVVVKDELDLFFCFQIN